MSDASPSPYNTRRKSLSLASLGIRVPGSNNNGRAKSTHRASTVAKMRGNQSYLHSPSGVRTSPTTQLRTSHDATPGYSSRPSRVIGNNAPAVPSPLSSSVLPPSRSSDSSPSTSPPSSPSRLSAASSPASSAMSHHSAKRSTDVRLDISSEPHTKRHKTFHQSTSSVPNLTSLQLNEPTPPPSPGCHLWGLEASCNVADANTCDKNVAQNKDIDFDSINDEIVEATIRHLLAIGNHPQLVRMLTNELIKHLSLVQNSANPAAIVSSRLTAFIKRPCWSQTMPCPLAKELESVHPRRTYYYLTTMPLKPFLPDGAVSTVSPSTQQASLPSTVSVSETAAETEEGAARRRHVSPPIDLSCSPLQNPLGLYDDIDNTTLKPTNMCRPPQDLSAFARPLQQGLRYRPNLVENDESDFSKIASGLRRQRKMSGDLLRPVVVGVEHLPTQHVPGLGDGVHSWSPVVLPQPVSPQIYPASSPLIRPFAPVTDEKAVRDCEAVFSIEPSEIDGLFELL